jgi:ribose transport system permease protein
MGQLLVIVTRGIDLSVGSTLALSTVVGALVFTQIDSTAVVVAAILLTGLAVGTVNGVGYVVGRLPHPFIMTLATLSIARGLALWLSDGRPIQGMPEPVQALGSDTLFGWLPVSTILVAAIALLVVVLMTRMVWGRWIYAVGGNPDAARRTGIPVGAVLISVYVLSGLAAGVGGLLTAGRTDAGAPTFGTLAELDAIAAVVIGGASFLGGRGHVGNAIVGAWMIGVIRNGMNLLNVDSFFQPLVIGVVIVLAVELDVIRGHVESRFRVLQASRIAPHPWHLGHPGASLTAPRSGSAACWPSTASISRSIGARSTRSWATTVRQVHPHQVHQRVHRLDSGAIEMDGHQVDIPSPRAARALGIETVYQDLALFDNLPPAANFYAGRELSWPTWLPRGMRFLHGGAMDAATSDLLDRLQVTLPEQRVTVGLMSGGQRQAVAVARAAAFASKVVILDEPTAALGVRESRRVLDLITRLRVEGHAVLVISHALDHVIEVADRAVVLRRGRKVGEEVPTADNQQRIVSLIVGGEG